MNDLNHLKECHLSVLVERQLSTIKRDISRLDKLGHDSSDVLCLERALACSAAACQNEFVQIFWLDTYVGQLGHYNGFKYKFQDNLKVVSILPPNDIDKLTCAFEATFFRIKFFDTIEKALAGIELHRNKRIIFISSGSLGKFIIPRIVSTFFNVYSFYVYCCDISLNRDWAFEYFPCVKIFDHELDLLVRLMRDISSDAIRLGTTYLAVDDPTSALKCFEAARELDNRANNTDTLNQPYYGHLRILDDNKSKPGLIQKALIMRQQQVQARFTR